MEVKDIFKTMDYGPAVESRENADNWITSHNAKFGHYIDGEWKRPNSNKYLKTVNPGDKKTLAQFALGNKKDVDSAVKSAKKALNGWKKLGCHGRARYMYAIARQIQKNSRLFAVLESLDNGKPIRESRDLDVPLAARHFYHHAGWAQVRDNELPGYVEIGVVGQIIPWNFPILMLAWKIAPAIAMGNTVVLKPAEYTPLTALLFAEICMNVGLPAGVVNILTGAGETGAELVKHHSIDKIAFTGSTQVGKIIRKSIAGTGKKLSLELGGKSPYIVFEDADLDSAVEGLVDAIWFNQGEVCCAGSKLLVQESVEKEFIRKLKRRMGKLRIGNALDKAIDIGAVVDKVQIKTISKYVNIGIDEGGTMWQPNIECPKDGFFYPPTLFTDISPADTVAQEEIFGPVLVALSFRTPAEAVKLANNTRYGLASSVWTENINLALDIAPKIKAGTVWVNCTNFFDAASGFGGYRESGFGREGGKEGLYEYVKPGWEKNFKNIEAHSKKNAKTRVSADSTLPSIDRTAKFYIGGKQARPDGGYSRIISGAKGELLAEVGEGNRKDVRNAVEAAHSAQAWANATSHNRAQVLYYIAENLETRKQEFSGRLTEMTGQTIKKSTKEVELSIDRIYTYAGLADKYDGNVHRTPFRNVTLAMPEPVGVMAIVCPNNFPLLGFISSVMPAIAMGNRVIVIPSQDFPLAATDFYQVLDTSDLPGGVVNIITGDQLGLTRVLADHYDVEGIWFFGPSEGSEMIESVSAENMKRTWANYGKERDWVNPDANEAQLFLRKATEIKNIWVPYGE